MKHYLCASHALITAVNFKTRISPDFSFVCIPLSEQGRDFLQLLSPANTYAAKKTVAQGMMDIALITANANQLRYILEFGERNTVFYVITTLIVISILLQV
jgi:hypothetical protein